MALEYLYDLNKCEKGPYYEFNTYNNLVNCWDCFIGMGIHQGETWKQTWKKRVLLRVVQNPVKFSHILVNIKICYFLGRTSPLFNISLNLTKCVFI